MSANDDKVMERLIPLVMESLDHVASKKGIMRDTPLRELGLDSIAAISLLLAVEDEFSFEFPDELLVIETLSSLNSLADAIQSCRNA